jgi:hypothetical protein
VEVLPEDNVPPGTDFTALYVLLNAAFLPHLRWLRIGEAENLDGHGRYNSEADGYGLVELVERTPLLEELEVLAHNVDMARLFALDCLPRLRSLLVYHGVEEYPLEVLAANPALPALERIRLHPAHGGDEGSFLVREQVAALCRTPHLPALRHLHLHGSDLGDEGCRDIVASGILKRLKTLDLRFGCITDEGAGVLAACPDIRNLEHLSLADNQLTDQGQSLLRELGISVNVEGQDEVGGDEYLWTGDME